MCSYHRTITQTTHTAISRIKTLFCFAFMCIACPSMALAYDFTLGANGATRVVLGHDLYVQVTSAITEGTRDYAFYYVDGLPSGATVTWPTAEGACCGGNRNWLPGNWVARINVPESVPTGTYNLTLRLESGDIKKQMPYLLAVEPTPGPLAKQIIKSIPPIPSLSAWEANMVNYGKKLCNEESITKLTTWEGNLWYYDGMRVYFQIADYTKDDFWKACVGYIENVYKPYAMSGATGWRVFPHGLYQDYLRNNDATSKDAAIALATVSSFAKVGGGVIYGVNGMFRESAYLIHAYRIAGLLGSPNPKLYARAVDFVLGAIDQEFVSNSDPYQKPFMTGLLMEALIQYYEESKDPRVPPAIKAAVDGLWDRAWIPGKKAFYYESTAPATAAPDVNMLIAPAYAWIYKLTGDTVYQQRGDLIFQGAVEGAWLDQGKQFNQSYRWSFDYVNWRMHPDIDPPVRPASLKVVK